MNGDLYGNIHPTMQGERALTPAQVRDLRAQWARLAPEVVDYFERMQDEQARAEGRAHENKRRLRGGLAAVLVSAIGLGVFIGLCFVWGSKR